MLTLIKATAVPITTHAKRSKRLKGNPPLYPTSATPYAAYPPGELDIFLHNRYTLGVDGAEIRVFEEVYQERLG
jgi:hypothetical protein